MAADGSSGLGSKAMSSSQLQTRSFGTYQLPTVEPHTSEDENAAKKGNKRKSPWRGVQHGKFLEGLSEELQIAAIDASRTVTEAWMNNQLADANSENLDSLKKSLRTDSQVAFIDGKIRQSYKDRQGKEVSKDISNILKDSNILDFFIETAAYSVQSKATKLEQEKRAAIHRILKVNNDGGTYYDILGIKPTAGAHAVTKAWKALGRTIHPDKNRDEESTNCTKLINEANEHLSDEWKRSQYDKTLRSKPKSKNNNETFNEEFHPNAYQYGGLGESGDEGDDEDIMEIPDIPKDIKALHKELRKYIERFFSNFENPEDDIMRKIEEKNKMIKESNEEATRNPDLYQVPQKVLEAFRQRQEDVVETQKTKGSKAAKEDLQNVRLQYEKTRAMRMFQWPKGWWVIIESAVQKRLDEVDDSDSSSSSDNDNDSEFEGNQSIAPDVMSLDTSPQPQTRRLQGFKPGYTSLGDRILGCKVYWKWSVIENKKNVTKVKLFIERDENPKRIIVTSDIGDQAARDYYNLPENEKNDVSTRLETMRKMGPQDFLTITRVGWVEPVYPPERGYPETWISVEMKDDEREFILNRTALREFLRPSRADKLIDDFCVNNDIVPPWANTYFPDPQNRTRYLSLEYPAPRRARVEQLQNRAEWSLESSRRRPRLEFDSYRNGRRLEFDTYRMGPRPPIADSGVESLEATINKLAQMVLEVKDEQKQLRMLLLPAP
ncbi:Fc.00g056290.m01.CDS01 [Cosmosporella sp. VM-42]